MLIAAVLCLFSASAFAVLGTRALARPAPADGPQRVYRAVAPTQLAAAVMLIAGGVVALSGRGSIGLLVLCVVGALGTVAVGLMQGAKYAEASAMRRNVAVHANGAGCHGPGQQLCGGCNLSCG